MLRPHYIILHYTIWISQGLSVRNPFAISLLHLSIDTLKALDWISSSLTATPLQIISLQYISSQLRSTMLIYHQVQCWLRCLHWTLRCSCWSIRRRVWRRRWCWRVSCSQSEWWPVCWSSVQLLESRSERHRSVSCHHMDTRVMISKIFQIVQTMVSAASMDVLTPVLMDPSLLLHLLHHPPPPPTLLPLNLSWQSRASLKRWDTTTQSLTSL